VAVRIGKLTTGTIGSWGKIRPALLVDASVLFINLRWQRDPYFFEQNFEGEVDEGIEWLITLSALDRTRAPS